MRRHHRAPCVAAFAFCVATASFGLANESGLTNTQIADAVLDELQYDPAIDANALSVSVENGIVELVGEQPNLLAKWHAVEEARALRGVRAVVDRIDVTRHLGATDAVTKGRVDQALESDPVTEPWELEAKVEDGVVRLSGTVDSHAERLAAERVVAQIVGVRGVDNHLSVVYDSDRSDAELAGEVRRRLRWDARIDGAFIDVKVREGKVSLVGRVDSAAQRIHARDVAWVVGVHGVDISELKVAALPRADRGADPERAISDEEIEMAIAAALLSDPRVNASRVSVHAHDGEVTLRGSVTTARARLAAERDAQLTNGVWRVENRLRVKTPNIDEALTAARVEKTIRADPYLSEREIEVSVVRGWLRLSGVVDSHFEKQRAQQVVLGLEGIQSLTNAIEVRDEQTFIEYDPEASAELGHPRSFSWYAYRPLPREADAVVRGDIVRELIWNPFVDAEDVRVYVDDGVATLAGDVSGWLEMNAAVQGALEGGAVAVDNELRMRRDD